MRTAIYGVSSGIKALCAVGHTLISRERAALRESNYFTLRFFVSLEVVLFYFVGVVYLAATSLPESPYLYALFCGATGVLGATFVRSAWTIGKAPRGRPARN